MITAETAEARLSLVIDALGTAGFAPALTDWLRGQVIFDNMTILAYPGHDCPRVLHAEAREPKVHARLGSAYVAGAYLLDPFHQMHLDGAEGLFRLADVAPDHFMRTEYFMTYYQDTTLIDEATFMVRPTRQVTVTICLGRDGAGAERFLARDMVRARALAPLVGSLVRHQWSGLTAPEVTTNADISETLRNKVAESLGIEMTPRQAQTAVLVLKGHSSGSIALAMGVSPETVKVFRKQLYRKCSISSQAELFSLLLPMLG